MAVSPLELSIPRGPAAYDGDRPFVFVSYCHGDRAPVLAEILRLHNAGYRIWYDEGIRPGSEWPAYIEKSIKGSACCLAFVTQQAVDSQNVRNEINLALKLRKPFIAVYLEPVELRHGLELSTSAIHAIARPEMTDEDFHRKLDGALPDSCRNPIPARTVSHDPGPGTSVKARELVRIAAQTATQNGEPTLVLDLGLARARLCNKAGERLPLVCGCDSAQCEVHFKCGRSPADPKVGPSPDGTRVIVQFGIGQDPKLRLEAAPPAPFVEGRVHVEFRVDLSGPADGTQPSGAVTVKPDWFFVGSPGSANRVPLDMEILVNGYLKKSVPQSQACKSNF